MHDVPGNETGAATAWHALPVEDVATRLETSPQSGLAQEEAARRTALYGANTLPGDDGRPWWRALAGQFTQFLVLVLIVAALVSAALGELLDAGVILTIVVLNGVLGFTQEHQAEQSLNALKSLEPPMATVTRDGRPVLLRAEELVPGDLVQLQAGDVVPADGRLAEAVALRIDESILTGESVAAEKRVAVAAVDTDLGDRHSMVYQGGRVVHGRAAVLVTATGLATELGKIAVALQRQPPSETPLQRRLADTGRWLVYGAAGLCALVFAVGLARGIGTDEMFLTSVSLAVAAIPEGLPAATTVVLAIGVQRMAARKAVVRRLSAVEALGSVTVICTDKTGTLTENRMRVKETWAAGVDVNSAAAPAEQGAVHAAIVAAVLCNDATPSAEGDGGGGDPTEIALLDYAQGRDLDPLQIRARSPRVGEIPFDAERARMTVVCERDGERTAYTKGAPEVVLARCARIAEPMGMRELLDESRGFVLAAATEMASRGVRVLAIAERPFAASSPVEDADSGLTFLALLGLSDPLRATSASSIAATRAAGIRVVMLTGDHPETARAIAAELGLPVERVALGGEVEDADDEALERLLESTHVFARVSSAHKPRIIEALRSEGHIVAMTGDGVNDAPALKLADIGVAMTGRGTDVARDASDIVLLDNNFATIVAAIEEGRTVYDNIRKFVHYLLACNSAEVAVVFLLLVFTGVTPLLPAQILFINLVTDGLPALALGREPPEPAIMSRRPRPTKGGILTRESLLPLAGIGTLVAAPTIVAYAWGKSVGGEELARQLAFATLVGTQTTASFAFRSPTESIFRLRRNSWLVGAAVASVALLLAVTTLPWLQTVFRTHTLSPVRWLGVAGLSCVPLVAVEALKLSGLAKWVARRQAMS